jgi:hypothetical protein
MRTTEQVTAAGVRVMPAGPLGRAAGTGRSGWARFWDALLRSLGAPGC